jgi:hypothetical protein
MASVLTAALLQPLAGTGQGLEDLGPRFELDLDQYRKTNPDYVVFREVGTLNLGIDAPRAIAVAPDGTVYAAGEKDVISLDAGGETGARWDLPAPATSLACGPDGRLYVGAGGAVYLLKPGSTEAETWTDLGEGAVITSVVVTSNRLFLADAGNRMAAVFGHDARLLGILGRKNRAQGIPGLIVPSPYLDVAPGEGGDVWLANPGRLLVARYRPSGERLQTWGEPGMNIEGFCGCCNPIHLAVLPDGRFVTSEKGIPRVKVYHPDGTFAGVVAGTEAFHKDEDGLDLAVDRGGRVYVLDTMRGMIRIYAAKESGR